jgi:L-lactate dehydrogenase complex protein LldF
MDANPPCKHKAFQATMVMKISSLKFREKSVEALADAPLQKALANIRRGFVVKRAKARAALPEFDALREEARLIKDHALDYLDIYLEEYERKVIESGGHVHWARTAEDACAIIVGLCQEAGARSVTKGKSMIAEEIGLNAALEFAGIAPVETDLGEYLIQLRGETPSHIIAPAIHLTRDKIADDFRRAHPDFPSGRRLEAAEELVAEARAVLREKFLKADVGITGANMLIAETGSSVIVTNEGNGDLTQLLPRTHIVVASIEKVTPTLEDADVILRLLARSATGQEISTYTTFSTGPRRPGDPDGPDAYHVVLLDNGRSEMLGGPMRDMLRCIRCGACLNHCPVYNAVGGHAYGSVYPGPMGAVLTPHLGGLEEARLLPNASTFCGRCEAVCPMSIPLTRMMLLWREREFDAGLNVQARALGWWAWAAARPKLYHLGVRWAMRALRLMARGRGRLARAPYADAWTGGRDLPAPQGPTFHDLWRKELRRRQRQREDEEFERRREAEKGGW